MRSGPRPLRLPSGDTLLLRRLAASDRRGSSSVQARTTFYRCKGLFGDARWRGGTAVRSSFSITQSKARGGRRYSHTGRSSVTCSHHRGAATHPGDGIIKTRIVNYRVRLVMTNELGLLQALRLKGRASAEALAAASGADLAS